MGFGGTTTSRDLANPLEEYLAEILILKFVFRSRAGMYIKIYIINKPPPGEVISYSNAPRSPGGDAASSSCESAPNPVGVRATMLPKPRRGASVDAMGLAVAASPISSPLLELDELGRPRVASQRRCSAKQCISGVARAKSKRPAERRAKKDTSATARLLAEGAEG